MVVFAALVALAVEEWRDERQMHEFADRARMGVVTEQLAVVGAAIDAAVADIRHENFVGQREHTRESHTDLTRPSARPTNRVRVESLGVEDSSFLRLEVCDVDVARVVGIDADDLAELVLWLSE